MKVVSVFLLAAGFVGLLAAPASAAKAKGFDFAVARLTVDADAIHARVTMVSGERKGTDAPAGPAR